MIHEKANSVSIFEIFSYNFISNRKFGFFVFSSSTIFINLTLIDVYKEGQLFQGWFLYSLWIAEGESIKVLYKYCKLNSKLKKKDRWICTTYIPPPSEFQLIRNFLFRTALLICFDWRYPQKISSYILWFFETISLLISIHQCLKHILSMVSVFVFGFI